MRSMVVLLVLLLLAPVQAENWMWGSREIGEGIVIVHPENAGNVLPALITAFPKIEFTYDDGIVVFKASWHDIAEVTKLAQSFEPLPRVCAELIYFQLDRPVQLSSFFGAGNEGITPPGFRVLNGLDELEGTVVRRVQLRGSKADLTLCLGSRGVDFDFWMQSYNPGIIQVNMFAQKLRLMPAREKLGYRFLADPNVPEGSIVVVGGLFCEPHDQTTSVLVIRPTIEPESEAK